MNLSSGSLVLEDNKYTGRSSLQKKFSEEKVEKQPH